MTRLAWVAPEAKLPISRQCMLVGVPRSTVYAQRMEPQMLSAEELVLRRVIDEQYTLHPFYGTRRMAHHMGTKGYVVNRKRVQRLMRAMGLAGMAPGPNTSKGNPEHKVYPYLLRGVAVTRPNQVWSTDITYIRLQHGFAYLVAVIDWYSRKVLGWRISNTMEAVFCVDCLEDALRTHGKPEVFNSDQGSQFTSEAFTGVLKREDIKISMDGRGRAFDNIFVERLWRNVKYEDIYLKGYANMGELMVGLAQYMAVYNMERPHQSLGYMTPSGVYRTSIGGGALIVDKFGDAGKLLSVSLRSTDSSLPAETTATATAEPTATATAEATATATAESKGLKAGQHYAACDLIGIA